MEDQNIKWVYPTEKVRTAYQVAQYNETLKANALNKINSLNENLKLAHAEYNRLCIESPTYQMDFFKTLIDMSNEDLDKGIKNTIVTITKENNVGRIVELKRMLETLNDLKNTKG